MEESDDPYIQELVNIWNGNSVYKIKLKKQEYHSLRSTKLRSSLLEDKLFTGRYISITWTCIFLCFSSNFVPLLKGPWHSILALTESNNTNVTSIVNLQKACCYNWCSPTAAAGCNRTTPAPHYLAIHVDRGYVGKTLKIVKETSKIALMISTVSIDICTQPACLDKGRNCI